MSCIDQTIHYATDQHASQFRKGTNIPYILRPLETMSILMRMNADTNLLIAGSLHDTIEDTGSTYDDKTSNIQDEACDQISHSEAEKREDEWNAPFWKAHSRNPQIVSS